MIRLLHVLSQKQFALGAWLLLLVTSALAVSLLFGIYGFVLGLCLGLAVLGKTLQHFVVFVPKKSALLVLNVLNKNNRDEGEIRVLLSGLNFKYPWEQIYPDGRFSLKETRVSFSEKFPASDGPMVSVNGSFSFAPDPRNPERLLQFFLSQDIVLQMALDKIGGYLSQLISKKKAVTARNQMKQISEMVTCYFDGDRNDSDEEARGTKEVERLEKRYGIVLGTVTVANIGYEESFQKARATREATKTLRKAADDARKPGKDGSGGIPPAKAWDNVLVVHGVVKKQTHVQEVEGQGLEALAALLVAAVRGRTSATEEGEKQKGNQQ